MNYEYSFDYGKNPCFVIDAWFKKVFLPIFILCAFFFPLSYFSSTWVTRHLLPGIAIGALIVFFGILAYRRNLAMRRVRNLSDKVFRYRIDDEGLHYENGIGSGVMKWGFKGKLVPVRHFILLMSNEIGSIPLPKDTPHDVLSFVESRIRIKQ